jgi:hypothetical protein
VKSFQSPEVKKLVDSSFGGSPVAAFWGWAIGCTGCLLAGRFGTPSLPGDGVPLFLAHSSQRSDAAR